MSSDKKRGAVRIKYLARWTPSASSGVTWKIKNATHALKQCGYKADYAIVEKQGVVGHLLFVLEVAKASAELLILRATAYSMLLVFPVLLIKRLMGVKVVVDVPTPMCSVLKEIDVSQNGWFKKLVLRSLIKASYPLSLFPANRVVQYSLESKRFSFGVERKTVLSANGINVSSIQRVSLRRTREANSLNLIGVAALEDWHGYDRLIRGLKVYYSSPGVRWDVRFLVVGDGGARGRLELLVGSLGLNDRVKFYGVLTGTALKEVFDHSDIGVSSLAVHRKGLKIASDLKTREYLARGLPAIICADDPDLTEEKPFLLRQPADDSPINIESLVIWYAGIGCVGSDPDVIRDYAFKNFDYINKVSVYTKDLVA